MTSTLIQKKQEEIMRVRNKLVIIIAIIAIIASPICVTINDAYAVEPVLPNGIGSSEISRIHNDLGEEAFAQLSWHILYKCVKGSYEERDTDFVPNDVFTDDDFFDYSRDMRGVVTVPTGYYLESKVQGGTDYDPDGAIYCRNNNNKILKIAADALGIDYKQILCDTNKPGIIRNRKKPTECNPSSTADDYEFSPDYNSHLQKLWNAKKAEKNWATTWGNIGNYGGVNGYVLYSYEAGVRCGGTNSNLKLEEKDKKPNGYYIEPPLETVGQDGGVAYQFFTADNELENNFVDNSYTTCSTMIARANSNTIKDAFREKVLVTFNDRCKNFYQEIIDDTTKKVSDEAKSEFDSKKSASGYGFLEDKDDPNDSTDTQDMQCVTIDGLLHPEQSDDEGYAEDADQEANDKEPSCYDQAGSLGWILCPLIDTMGKFILEKYEQWVEPALRIDVKLFSNHNETYESWKIFRDIANIVFIIFFIFVIFSQITGVGIDNYGIKKALPKIIAGAILINASYLICQIAVDLFNILGQGIAGIFNNISEALTINSIKLDGVSVNSDAWDSFTSNGALTAVIVIVVGAAVTGAVLTQGLAIIIPILLLVLSVAFTIFTLLAILAIRQALAVILVVLAPLAFVCYMLPNTKKLFDKWFKTFQGVLLAYPICSLAVYGGNMVGKILLNSAGENTWLVISSAIISVAPVFIIPKLITGSIGAIGAMASGFIAGKIGGMAKGAARGRLEHSALTRGRDYRQMRREQSRQARIGEYNYKRGQKTLDKLGKKNVADMSAAERARYRTAQGMVDAENRNRQSMYAQSFGVMSPSAVNDQIDSMIKSKKFDTNMTTAAIETLAGADQGEMLKTLTKLSSSESWSKMTNDDRSRVADALLAQKDNAVAQAYGKILKKSGSNVSFQDALAGNNTGGDSIKKRLSEMDSSVLANQDKDALNFIANTEYTDSLGNKQQLADAFTTSQVASAIASSDGTSKKSNELQAMLAKRENISDDIAHMSDAQFASAKSATLEGVMKKRFEESGARTNVTDSAAIMTGTIRAKVQAVQNDDNLKGSLDTGFKTGRFAATGTPTQTQNQGQNNNGGAA